MGVCSLLGRLSLTRLGTSRLLSGLLLVGVCSLLELGTSGLLSGSSVMVVCSLLGGLSLLVLGTSGLLSRPFVVGVCSLLGGLSLPLVSSRSGKLRFIFFCFFPKLLFFPSTSYFHSPTTPIPVSNLVGPVQEVVHRDRRIAGVPQHA